MLTRRTFLSTSAVLLAASFIISGCASDSTTDPTPNQPASIATWGDSITEGVGGTSYPTQLGALFGDNRLMYNGGHGAHTSTHTAFRMGLLDAALSVNGGEIPVSGSVGVTLQNPALVNQRVSIPGTLAGIGGTLTRDVNGAYRFTRTNAGAAMATANTAVFEPIPEKPLANYAVHIIMVGQNDARSTAGNQTVLDNLNKMVGAIQAAGKQFLILGVTGANAGVKGGSGYNNLLTLNNAIKAAYPTNYIDIRGTLIAAADKANAKDAIDHTNDIIPSSLRSDAVHLNTKGYGIVAKAVHEFILAKGWQ